MKAGTLIIRTIGKARTSTVIELRNLAYTIHYSILAPDDEVRGDICCTQITTKAELFRQNVIYGIPRGSQEPLSDQKIIKLFWSNHEPSFVDSAGNSSQKDTRGMMSAP